MNSKALKTVTPGGLEAMAGQVPAEAVVRAVEVIGTIVAGGFQMAADRQRFEHELEGLKQKDVRIQDRLAALLHLVDNAKITDDARDRVVATICELALK
jgi:hypothetical protein